MKTEGLTLREAMQALVDGHRIEDVFDREIWIDKELKGPGVLFGDGPWSIVQPKSLTYEEALACEEVIIYWPSTSTQYARCHSMPWFVEYLHNFDLAERRSYRMEKVR